MPGPGPAPRESFTLLIKPASADCNLRCGYCFYLDKGALFGPGVHRMDPATLEALTRAYFACPQAEYTFAWQGGEPTLMGLDFFREAVRLQQALAPPGARVANALQTNGTLLDDDWAAFLREHRFLVGISIDGPAALHDAGRPNAAGAGSHADVLRGLGVLRARGVDHNVLTLVSANNQDSPEAVYAYTKSLGVRFHQYIECVEFDAGGARRPHAVAPGRWGEFLCRLFDAWYPRDRHAVSVRLFDSVVSRLVSGRPTLCAMSGNCCGYFVVETNGDVFPCDFHVQPALRLGSVRETGFAAMRADPAYRAWGARKDPRPSRCSDCRYLPLCMGDCPKNRRDGLSALCADWQRFYAHTIDRFERLAAEVAAPAAPPGGSAKVGPNLPCPCGSGRKYKKCCGRA